MIKRIVIALLVAALAAAVVFGIVRGYEAWRAKVYGEGDRAGAARVQILWDDDRLQLLTRNAEAVARARAEEQQAAAAAAEGEAHARQRAEDEAKHQAAAAGRSAAAAGGLRDDIAALDARARELGIPGAAACPGEFALQRDAAIRARALFGACVAEYRLLAADAESDGAALRLQLATALSWIRATGAPGAKDLTP